MAIDVYRNVVKSGNVEKSFYGFEFQFADAKSRSLNALNIDANGFYLGLDQQGSLFLSEYGGSSKLNYFDDQHKLVTTNSSYLGTNQVNLAVKKVKTKYSLLTFFTYFFVD